MISETFKSKNGRVFKIELSENGDEINVYENEEEKGSITLRLIEGDYRHGDPDYYHINFLALEQCKGNGVGRACLKFHIETFGCSLTASSNDGQRKSDGSHLTEGGPGFIAKMREEGIVEKTVTMR